LATTVAGSKLGRTAVVGVPPRTRRLTSASSSDEVREAAKSFDLKIEWVSRDENAEADALTWSIRRS
jgi:hypothetical protein